MDARSRFPSTLGKTAGDLAEKHLSKPLLTVGSGEPVTNAISLLRKFDISQLPVVKDGKIVGTIDDAQLIKNMSPDILNRLCEEVMSKPLPIVSANTAKEEVVQLLCQGAHPAVLVEFADGRHHILTPHDLISAMS